MNPDQWLNSHFRGEFFSGNFNHLKDIVSKLDLYPTSSKIITVAGTNGKGQTCRFLAKLFLQQKKSYLLLTSPHLKKVNERFNLNGVEVSDNELVKTFETVRLRTLDRDLSYFEFLYLSFLFLAKKHSPYVLIQEVGLGGRLDATNVIDNDLSVLTSISRDHQEILGNSYKSILSEKLGILRREKKLISSLELSYLRQLTKIKVSSLKGEWIDIFDEKQVNTSTDFSERNKTLAVKAYETLEQEEIELIEKASYSAKRATVILGGASCDLFPTHNIDGLRKLIHFLGEEQYNNYDLVLFAPSRRSYKDLKFMGEILVSHYSEKKLRLVSFNHIKALDQKNLYQLKQELGLDIIDDIKLFKNHENARNILVLGSNYFLGELIG